MTVIEEKLEQVRKFLFGETPLPVQQAAPVTTPAPAPAVPVPAYTLQDGTAVEIDKLEVGGILKINAMPAAAGEYVLNDGTNVTTDANGVITEVESKAAETAEEAAARIAAQQPAPVVNSIQPTGANGLFSKEQLKEMSQKFAIGGTDERVAKLETLCTALMENVFGWELQNAERNATAKAAIEAYAGAEAAMAASGEKMSKYSEAVQGLFSVVEAIAKVPVAAPLETPKDSFKADKFQQKEEKTKAIAEHFAALKKIK